MPAEIKKNREITSFLLIIRKFIIGELCYKYDTKNLIFSSLNNANLKFNNANTKMYKKYTDNIFYCLINYE